MISVSVLDPLQETSHKEQEAFWSGIVTGAVRISPVDEDFLDPGKSLGEFVTSAIDIEKGQHVYADNWVEPQSLVIKIGLTRRLT